MTNRIPYAHPFDHLVYVRVFEGCNLHCEHCFIPKNPKRMNLETITGVADYLRKFAKPSQNILIQWHGGEPTLFGADWMAEAIERIESAAPEFNFRHGIQTNLMTYSKSWGQLFRDRFADGLGVSWDPQIRHLGRDDQSNAAYEEVFWRNFTDLINDGLDPYVVMTATKQFFETFKNPISLFEFLSSRGIRKAHIERLTETGYARDNWDRIGVDNAAFSFGMARILKAYTVWTANRDPSEPSLSISPFDGLLMSARLLIQNNPVSGYGCWSGNCDNRFHTIDGTGYKRGCTALTSEHDNKAARKSLELAAGFENVRRNRQLINCKECRFNSICSSGCLAVSMDDGSGECSGGYGMFAAALAVVESGWGFQ